MALKFQFSLFRHLIGLAFLSPAGATLHGQHLNWTAQFAPPHLETVHGETRVRVEPCEILRQAGRPLLPYRLVRLLLPPGSTLDHLEIRLPEGESAIPLNHPVECGRIPQSYGRGIRRMWPGAPEFPIHPSPLPFPERHAELLSVQTMVGYPIALVRIFPAQYLPTSRELKFAPQVQVELILAPAAGKPQPSAIRLASGEDRSRVAAWVDNPEILRPVRRLQNLSQSLPPATVDYLIITRSNLVGSFQPLAALKEQSGLTVQLETVESVSARWTGKDAPEKIRNFLKMAYADWGTRYVLLGGDATTVPCRYAYAHMNRPEVESLIPCDLYYACLDGTWNRDGDNRWGEPTDGEDGGDVDLLAELWVGRAPVDTPEEAAIFAEKQVLYQTTGWDNSHQVLVAAEFLDDFPQNIQAQGGDMFDPLLPFFKTYQIHWLDDRPGEAPRWNRNDAIAALNLSPHLLLFNGHGDIDRMMRLETTDLDALSNSWPFFVYSVGCNAGQFDNNKFSPDAIGEELIKRNRHGAFAAILNSRLGWYDPAEEWKYSGEFQLKYFEELLTRGQTRVGVANQLSKHALIGQIEASGLMPYRWCFYEINLLGDPHLAWQTLHLTSQGAPEWWLRQQGWTSQFEQAASRDDDGDGLATWQEFVAGTDPRDLASVLKLQIHHDEQEGKMRLTWPSAANRIYAIWTTDGLGEAEFLPLATNLPATPPQNSFAIPEHTTGPVYYRVKVQ